MIRTAKGLIAALAAVVGLIAMISVASAAVSSLGIESATVAPGADVTVNLTANATDPGIGSFEIKVVYDETLLTVKSCAKTTEAAFDAAVCNKDFGADTAFFTGASAEGAVGGTVNLGSITFTAGSTAGVAALDVQIQALTDPAGADVTVTPGDGTITIAVPATPTPSPSPSPVPATATPTPAALPPTGGAPSDSSTSSMALVLGTLGLAILAGGVWAVSRTRRESL